MIFNLKFVAGGAIVLTGIGMPFYLLLKKHCSYTKSLLLTKNSIDTKESILDCQGHDRNYSVFLVFKEIAFEYVKWEEPSFKVVDNNDKGKVKWGPGAKKEEEWTDWGIAVYKDGGKGTEKDYKTEIRVPKVGKVYDDRGRSWTTIRIPCQKSKLKLKQESGGRISRSRDTYFDILENNVVKMVGPFDWVDGFEPKRMFCSS